MNKEKMKEIGYKALKYAGWTVAAGFILFQTHKFAYQHGHIDGTLETREACTKMVQSSLNTFWYDRNCVKKRDRTIKNYDEIYPYLEKELIELNAKKDVLDDVISNIEYLRRDVSEYNPYD